MKEEQPKQSLTLTLPTTVTLPTVLLIAAITGAVGYAIGSANTTPAAQIAAVPATPAHPVADPNSMDPSAGEQLPVGHPAVSGMAAMNDLPAATPTTLKWTPPPRWQVAPNTSSMRLATYKIPHAAGDTEDAEMSVTQVGGGVDANIDRWIGQFGDEGGKNVKKTKRTVGGLTVQIVEIQGKFTNGMDQSGAKANWALLGAIVETPDMPHFFKMTGPSKTVLGARAELDALVDTLKN
jgi:hypothetical protein